MMVIGLFWAPDLTAFVLMPRSHALTQVRNHLVRNTLDTVPFFANLDNEGMQKVYTCLKPIAVATGDAVVKASGLGCGRCSRDAETAPTVALWLFAWRAHAAVHNRQSCTLQLGAAGGDEGPGVLCSYGGSGDCNDRNRQGSWQVRAGAAAGNATGLWSGQWASSVGGVARRFVAFVGGFLNLFCCGFGKIE